MVLKAGLVTLTALALGFPLAARGSAPPSQDRVQRLERSLVAPCCWSETVADHRSEVAATMRAEIAKFVAAGKSDREILDYYKAQYGSRVLIEPEGTTRIWANVIPWVAIALGIGFLWLMIRRMRRSRPAASTQTQPAGAAVDLDDEW